MPTLDWIGKNVVRGHHRTVPYHLLKCNKDLSVGDPGSGNLLIQGDNLLALKALLPYYAGSVKCIYIDPPYNTGKEGWVYNDNVNSPEIRQWLKQVVGKEGDDLSRHDKWLCMMYPRLALLKEFLADDGVLFMSIDDNELHHARLLLNDLFRVQNFLACMAWQTEGNFDNQARIKIAHEYVLLYAKDERYFAAPPVIDPNTNKTSKLFKPEIRNTVVKNGPGNPVSDFDIPSGFPASFERGTIRARANTWPHYDQDVVVEDSKVLTPVVARSGWSSKRILSNFVKSSFQPVPDTKQQLTRFELTETGAIEAVKIRPETQSHVISVIREVGTVQSAGSLLAKMELKFPYAKPDGLIRYLISMVVGKQFLVLDSFAGSGTTAHAVLAQNKADGGNRRFIVIEMDAAICRDVTAQRIRKAIEGYGDTPGLGGGFRFCTLAQPLFDEHGNICKEVTFADLAAHVYFTETGEPISKRAKSPLLGVHKGRAVYLLFNGILGDRRPGSGNVLTHAVAQSLPAHDGPKVVYGDACRLSPASLQQYGITFKQVPFELRVD